MTYNLLLKGKFRMNLEDFFRKDPGLLDQFKKCSSKDDFMNVAQENNMRFAAGKLDEVYEYIQKIKNRDELSDDALSTASGGVGNETKVEELNIGGTANSNGAPTTKLVM